MSIEAKFIFIGVCFLLAVFLPHHSKKDWLWLVAALGFTLGADYFLVLHNEHFLGVAVFCFVHVCYIFRVIKFRWQILSAFIAAWALAFFVAQSVMVFAAMYAILFAVNIYVNARAHRPKVNYFLTMAGLILFALCDTNVMLLNLQHYTGLPIIFRHAFVLMWIFYLPAQILLAVSAMDFSRLRFWRHI